MRTADIHRTTKSVIMQEEKILPEQAVCRLLNSYSAALMARSLNLPRRRCPRGRNLEWSIVNW
jgi:hypothetical protein